MNAAPERPCGIARRLGSITYDGLLILALWMVATLPVVIVSGADVTSGNLLFQMYLLTLGLGYLHLSWSRSGQTLGMRAWRIQVRPARRSPRKFSASAARLAVGFVSAAAFGLGFISALSRADRATWHDRASGTRLTVQPPRDST